MGFNVNRSRSRTRTTVDDYTPSEYVRLRGITESTLRDIIESGGGERYSGPFVAPLTPTEEEQLLLLNELQLPSDNLLAAEGLIGDVIGGDYLTPDSNPFLRSYVSAAQEQVREAYDADNEARRAMFARAGHRLPESSPFAMAQVEASGEFAEALSDIATQVYSGAYDAERERQGQYIELQQSLDAQRWQIAVQNLEAQALPRMIDQMGIDRALEEFYRRQELLAQALGIAGQLSAPTLGYTTRGSGDSAGWGIGSGGGGPTVVSTEG